MGLRIQETQEKEERGKEPMNKKNQQQHAGHELLTLVITVLGRKRQMDPKTEPSLRHIVRCHSGTPNPMPKNTLVNVGNNHW